MAIKDDLQSALYKSDPVLGKYQPLERILSVDDFNTGRHGWCTYFPDYDGKEDYEHRYPYVESLEQIMNRTNEGSIEKRMDRGFPVGPRPVPHLSTNPTWDVGNYGAWNTYCLKIPSLARAGHLGVAMKRLSSPWNAKFRVECYFSYKADQSDFTLGERDIRSFLLSFDVHDLSTVRESGRQQRRWWPGVRYHNADENGNLVQKWQLMQTGSWGTHDGPWDYLEDGWQELGFNRAPTKFHWHYLRFTFDLATYEYVDFHCYGKEFNVNGLTHVFKPPIPGWRESCDKTHGLVLPSFCIQPNFDKRCYLFLDSIVISASEN